MAESIEYHRRKGSHIALGCEVPAGISVDVVFIRFFEVFAVEDAATLRDGLIKLIPQRSAFKSQDDFDQSFNKLVHSVKSGGGFNIGWLSNDSGLRLFGPVQKLSSDDIQKVSVSLHKVSPSFVAVCYDVLISSSPASRITTIATEPMADEVKLYSLWPWSIGRRLAYLHQSTIKAQRIQACFDDIRESLIALLPSKLYGLFLKSADRELPYITVYALNGLPTEYFLLIEKLKTIRTWLGLFGIEMMDCVMTRCNGFSFARRNGHGGATLLLNADTHLRGVDLQPYGDNPQGFLSERARYVLDDLILLVWRQRFLSLIEKSIVQLRQRIFVAMNGRTPLARLAHLSDEVGKASLILERVKTEGMSVVNTEEFRLREYQSWGSFPYFKEIPSSNLTSNFTSWFEANSNHLDSLLNLMKRSLTDHVAVKNMIFSYRLQQLLGVLAVVSIVIAIGGLLGWDRVRDSLNLLMDNLVD